jgi:hypothetical protein
VDNPATFESAFAYDLFEQAILTKSRFTFDKRLQAFLDALVKTAQNRIVFFPEGHTFRRAQLDHEIKRKTYVIKGEGEYGGVDLPYPCGEERMTPWADKAKEGRVNPKGIPVLYVADDVNTAISEQRPWLDAYVSLATFTLRSRVAIVDCTIDAEPATGMTSLARIAKREPIEERERVVWGDINRAFSRPVTPSEDTAHYAPTQIIGETLKKAGFDGIAYKSSLGQGKNYALFDLDCATYTTCELYQIGNICVFEGTPLRNAEDPLIEEVDL